MNRRQFLTAAAGGACAGLCGASCTSSPSGGAGGESAPAPPAGPLDVGAVADYAGDGVYDRFAEDDGVLLIVRGGRMIATSAICTHKRATLRVRGREIVCPKHGSRFNGDGVPMNGPARDPLARYAVSVSDDGRVIVDRSHALTRQEWAAAGSYVTTRG